MSRQNFYRARKGRRERQVDEGLVVALVRAERRLQPRLGGRKLDVLLKGRLAEAGVKLGRDGLFKVLGRRRLPVEHLPREPRTTMGTHSLPTFPNRLREMVPAGRNQAWVADITYIRTGEGFGHLTLLTDAHSRKIVGWNFGKSLATDECLKALRMAMAGLPEGEAPLHHSDRGCQFCSRAYVEALRARGPGISMTELQHCAENAKAERANGILKQECGLGGKFRGMRDARKSVDEAIWLYNHRRPHGALGMRFPAEVHSEAA
jgi:putative transposase